MKKLLIALALGGALAGVSQAQTPVLVPAPQISQAQMQQAMLRQMQMMAAMFDYRRSRLPFDDTVAAVAGSAAKRGWPAPQVHDIQAAMRQAGNTEAKRMKVVSTCPPNANERLSQASGGKLPPLPCRYTVFEGMDGKTYVVRMNTEMFAKTMKGDAAKVLAEISAEEDAMLKGIAD